MKGLFGMSISNRAELLSLIAEVLGLPSLSLNDNSTIANPPEWDSFAQIAIMLEVEKHTNTRFSPEEISEINSVGKIVAFLRLTN